jgi:DNA mismatch repair protein MSH6
MQDIMNHPTFEATFVSIMKGLPDLERIVARTHAKNCRIKDFLKVLDVSQCFMEYVDVALSLNIQVFKKLSKGMAKLFDESESFRVQDDFRPASWGSRSVT